MSDTAAARSAGPWSRFKAWWTARDWPTALVVGAVATLIAVVVLRIWVAPMAVPINYAGDSNLVMHTIKQIIEGGWYYENPSVGAPFGLEQYDFPDGGQLQFAMFKIIGWLTGGAVGATFNLSFLAGYFAVAAIGYWALRRLGVSRPWAAALGVLYAHLPFHLFRIGHHYLAFFIAAPLAILLTIHQAEGNPAFVGEGGRWRLQWRHTETRVALIAVVLIGTTGAYYTIFAGLVLVTTGFLVFLGDRDRRRLLSTFLVAGALGAVLAATLVPTAAYRLTHGANPEVAVRSYTDIERYALKPVQMLLPVVSHRIEVLRGPMTTALTGVPGTEFGLNLGLIGASGLLLLLGAGLSSLVGGGERFSMRTRFLFLLAVGMILAAASGGFGASLGILGFTQLRAWNRIVVFIAFVVFVALGCWMTNWSRTRSGRLTWTLAAVLMLVGVFDQTWEQPVAGIEARAAEWEADAAFVGRIEGLLPEAAMVYQLPHFRYPENGSVQRMRDYDLLKGYLHSEDLRWSYPAMKGRAPEWQPALLSHDLPTIVEGLAAVGFQGLYIDRFGYADSAVGLEAELIALLSQEPIVSDNGRLLFFDLRPAGFDLRSRLTPEEVDALARATLLVDELPEP